MEHCQELQLGTLAKKLLLKRGLTGEAEIKAFLDPKFYTPTAPLEMTGMSATVDRLLAAVERGERICVYGDYDADGVTSTTVLVSVLRSIGARVCYHVPDRFSEGYGMNSGVIRKLADEGITLILTCDCGISNHTEIALAKELGLSVLVTDHHHLPPELPGADSIVNPQLLPDGHQAKYLPGVGVAYMLAKALYDKLGKAGVEEYLDVVALGVIADVVPLLQENRYLVQIGLDKLRTTTRPGLLALSKVSNLQPSEITEEDIGFQLVPRLNAAGRLASAAKAVELLLCEDAVKAESLAQELQDINQRRKEVGEGMYQEAVAMLQPSYAPCPIVLYQPHWHHGVIGIIAGRLAEQYRVPVLLMSLKEDGFTITGSARSIPGVHIFEVLQRCANLLNKFGGHAGAAGFSLDRDQLDLFSKAVTRELEQAMEGAEAATELGYDLELGIEEIDSALYQQLLPLAPFGEGNPMPLFCSRNVEVLSQRSSRDEKHLRLVFGAGNSSLPAIWWGSGAKQLERRQDVIYSLNLNKWQGKETLQLVVAGIVEEATQLEVVEPKAVTLEVIDLRQRQDLGLDISAFANPQFFAENTQGRIAVATRDRYGIDSCDCLVLFTPPPGPRVLQELLAVSRAGKLVLAYAPRESEGDKEFLQRLLGRIKYAVTHEYGLLDLRYLAVATGHMEITVSAGLSFLQAKGLIKFEYEGPEQLRFSRGDGKTKLGIEAIENKLRTLHAETRAFRRYLLKATPENILRLISATQSQYQQLG